MCTFIVALHNPHASPNPNLNPNPILRYARPRSEESVGFDLNVQLDFKILKNGIRPGFVIGILRFCVISTTNPGRIESRFFFEIPVTELFALTLS